MYDSMPPGPDLQRTVLGPPPDEWGPLYPPWPSFGDHNKPAYCVGALMSDYIRRDLAEAGFCVWEIELLDDPLVWRWGRELTVYFGQYGKRERQLCSQSPAPTVPSRHSTVSSADLLSQCTLTLQQPGFGTDQGQRILRDPVSNESLSET